MPKEDNKIHISRNGSPLGVYDSDQVSDMLERGQLQSADLFYDEGSTSWRPLSEWKTEEPAANFKRAEDTAPPEEGGNRSGQRRRGSRSGRGKKKGSEGAIFGWIGCLFALVVAAGIYAYAAHLQTQLSEREREILDLKATHDKLKREIQFLTELAPAGRTRAIITYEPAPNQVAIMSGATVTLYRRADVEEALSRLALRAPESASSLEAFEQGIETLKSSIPSPLEVALTDSNGRVDLPVPEPGDYVLVASAGKNTPMGLERYLWMIGFRSDQQPSSLILLNEKNATSLRNPRFSIVDVQGVVSGVKP
jgi:hypothetical protein